MQKIFLIESDGHKNIVKQSSKPIPAPGANEVLIRHTAIGVNFADYEYLRSVKHKDGKKEIIPGIEAVGVIEEYGQNVTNFSKGQRVGYILFSGGAYVEFRVVKSSQIFPIPEAITDEAAVLNLVKGITAHYLLRRTFFLREGMTIIIHGAASNVGKLMLRLCSEYKINTIATVGSDDKKQIVKDIYASEVFNYNKENFVQGSKIFTKDLGVHVVYDFIGGDLLKRSLECMVNFGLAVSAGSSSSRPNMIDPLLLSTKSLFLTAPRFHSYKKDKPELMMSVAEVFSLIAANVFPSEADKKYSFNEIPDALDDIASRVSNSRVILV